MTETTRTRSKTELDRRRFMALSSLGLAAFGLPVSASATPLANRASRRDSAQEGGRIIYGYGAEAVNLDAGDAIDRPSFDVAINIYEGLVELDTDGNIVPGLAESWDLSDDMLTWHFVLREGVTFHDGTPFNAEAVKFNFDRVLDEANALGGHGQWEPLVAEVNVASEYEVDIVTKQPAGGLLNQLASAYGGMISPTAVAESGADFSRQPVGTGPFRFGQWDQGERIVLLRNDNYWNGAPVIDELEFRVISQDAARVLALESGDVDVIAHVSAQNIPLLRENESLAVVQKPTYRLLYWAFNNTKDVFQDVRVRQAFNFAIDREALVEFTLQGVGIPADAPISPTVIGYTPMDTYTYDADRATQMLEEAGFPSDWQGVAFVTEGRYYMDRQVAEAIQGMLAGIGVNVSIEVMEWGAFVDAVWSATADSELAQERDFAQTAYGGADAGQTFRSTLFSEYWPTAGYNEALFASEEVDELILAVEQSVDEESRLTAIQALSEAVYNAAPWIFSHFEQQVVAHNASVSGIDVLPTESLRFRNAQRAG